MEKLVNKSILIGNGININFGGNAYSNNYIIKRIRFNARANRYDPLFNGEISGDDIAGIFKELATWTNDIAGGKYDEIIPDGEKPILEDFKRRYNWKLSHYYEVGLEDWLFILHVYFLQNSDIAENWSSAKQGFERMMLDAIWNDGDIQKLYETMGKPVKRWLLEFSNVFTLNYDNNIENLIKRPVFHLHGDFCTPADSENPQTLMGYIRCSRGENVVVPQFKHCFCNAIFDYAGEHKYKIACAFEKGAEGLRVLEKSGISPKFFPAPIEKLLLLHKEHPELTFGSNYHFTEFRELTGELHIIGMSPNNDSHIFKLIDESNIENILFYYHSDSEARIKLPVHQKVEYRSAKELWKRLDASPKQFNCNYPIPIKSEKEIDLFEAFNRMSDDRVSEEEIIKCANAIPQFKSAELCKTAMDEMKTQQELGAPVNEKEQHRRFREITRIALRNGVLPSALYLHVVMGMNANKE